MKFMKYAMITLIFAIVCNIIICFASTNPIVYTLMVNYKLEGNYETRTPWIDKIDWEYPTYENLATKTLLANPCDNCHILAKPYDDDGNVYVGVVTVKGEKQTFRDPTAIASPNTYSLGIRRLDVTLMNTEHSGLWTINKE